MDDRFYITKIYFLPPLSKHGLKQSLVESKIKLVSKYILVTCTYIILNIIKFIKMLIQQINISVNSHKYIYHA